MRLQAAIRGIGIALLPEQVVATPLKEGLVKRVLSEWSGGEEYPPPRLPNAARNASVGKESY